MTDNKCANPEYSLEVDEMIMEYLLYNTTKAHLHNFGSRQRPEDDNHGLSAESAATLLQVFDQFLQLFKLNHFVVLFTHRKSPEVLSPSAREQLKQLSKQNAVIRIKRWDTSCSNHGPSSAEERIFDSWRDFFALPGSAVSREQTDLPGNIHAEEADFISLLDLLPKFLDLSADMAANLGQDVTEQWMFLAAEFMLQSAWEKYVYLDADPNEQPLIIAFGWGRWDRGEELDNALTRADVSEEVKAMEVRVDAMFSTSDESSGEATGQEIPEWTKIRLEHLSTFGNLPQGMEAGKHAQRWQVKQLRKIADLFPAEVFDGKVMDYLEGLWKLGRKPLLVQIEQGKIEGLTKEDFDGFMQNVFPKGPGSQEIGQSGKWWS